MHMRMARVTGSLVALSALAGACTTTEEIVRPDGRVEYLIACGASLGWNVCYDRANEVCPDGYETLREEAGFNRKELRIYCPNEAR
jgi:hypothetical protein